METNVSSGAFLPAPRLDAAYAGVNVPMQFVRTYTSLDAWPYQDKTRIGLRWFNTLDERLYDGTARAAPLSTAATLVHRTSTGRGRAFICANGTCTTTDGSLDTIVYVPAGQDAAHWELRDAGGVTTWFNYGGASGLDGALWKRIDKRGDGWTVTWNSSGSLAGYPASMQDHLGRRMDFNWTQVTATTPVRFKLASISDKSGTTLATFEYDTTGFLLTSATTANAAETYGYYMPSSTTTLPLLTSVSQNGQQAVSVTYDYAAGEGTTGRVIATSEHEGSYRFRYRSATDARNVCSNPSQSTLIVDRSTAPVGQSSCTDDVAGDAWCTNAAGALAVCDGGLRRAATCQTYGDLVGGAGSDRITAVSGNCTCGGGQTFGWTSGGSEAPRRMQYEVARDGKITSYAYDARGRLVASCDNDSDYVVTTTASSCPSTGHFRLWDYGRADYPVLVTLERERSRLASASFHDVSYTFDPNYPELTSRTETGLTRNAANDTNTTETQTTTWTYDSWGRRTLETRQAGEKTSYTYYATSGNQYGLQATSEDWVNSQGTTRLVTTLSSYTALGQAGSVTLPSTASRTLVYDYGGMRLRSVTIAGETTSYDFDAGGRMSEVTDPSGRRVRFSYDSLGRIQYQDVRDSATALAADRLEYSYDVAGRRTQVQYKRLDSSGNPGSAIWTSSIAYDDRGFEKTVSYGTRANIQLTRDSYGLGRLTQLLREDSDQVTAQWDAFGRETELRRYITGQSSGAYTSTYAQAGGNASERSLPTQITDPHSVVRTYVYDDFARLVRSDSVDYGTLRWGYMTGRLSERRLSNGKRTAYGYDFLGRVTTINHDADNPTLVGQDYQFVFDNGDGGVACGVTGTNCTYRRGRLAIAKIENAPAVFWNLEYDYTQDGQVAAELWPSSRQTSYTYDAQGRLLRVSYPVQTGDKVRYEYDTTQNDGEDPRELRRVVHELTPGVDYVVWARSMQHDATGRLTRAWFADRADGGNPSIDRGFNTDGTPSTWVVRRRSGSSDVDLVNRTFAYWPDGMPKGWSSSVGADPGRTFFYDGANRLTCGVNASGASTCPAAGQANLLESFTYDTHENRLTRGTSAGATTYSNPYANNQLWDEYPPGHTIWYGYDSNTFGGRTYDRHASVTDPNQRNYYYYASGQLRSISMSRPGTTQGTYQTHEFTILYDHLGRPIYVADKNVATSKERRENLYWRADDALLERVVTPDHTAATTYNVDIFAPIEQGATAWMQLAYVNGSLQSESRRYAARDAVGLVPGVYSFTGVGATSVAYTADYLPFGEVRASSGTANPALGFEGQLTLVGSDVLKWNGAQTTLLRSALAMTRWRTYDARVGQVLLTSELDLRVAFAHVYGSANPWGSLDRPFNEPSTWRPVADPRFCLAAATIASCAAACWDEAAPACRTNCWDPSNRCRCFKEKFDACLRTRCGAPVVSLCYPCVATGPGQGPPRRPTELGVRNCVCGGPIGGPLTGPTDWGDFATGGQDFLGGVPGDPTPPIPRP